MKNIALIFVGCMSAVAAIILGTSVKAQQRTIQEQKEVIHLLVNQVSEAKPEVAAADYYKPKLLDGVLDLPKSN